MVARLVEMKSVSTEEYLVENSADVMGVPMTVSLVEKMKSKMGRKMVQQCVDLKVVWLVERKVVGTKSGKAGNSAVRSGRL
jgi:hypothetical protein